MSRSTLESTLEQLSLTANLTEEVVAIPHTEDDSSFARSLKEHRSTESDRTIRCSPDTTDALQLPETCNLQVTQSDANSQLHPSLQQFDWAHRLFAQAARLSDSSMTQPDAILDNHLARVWRKRARKMTAEDQMDDSSQIGSSRPYRSRRRRGSRLDPRWCNTTRASQYGIQSTERVEGLHTNTSRDIIEQTSPCPLGRSTLITPTGPNPELSPASSMRDLTPSDHGIITNRCPSCPHDHDQHHHHHHYYYYHHHHHYHHCHHSCGQCENCPQKTIGSIHHSHHAVLHVFNGPGAPDCPCDQALPSNSTIYAYPKQLHPSHQSEQAVPSSINEAACPPKSETAFSVASFVNSPSNRSSLSDIKDYDSHVPTPSPKTRFNVSVTHDKADSTVTSIMMAPTCAVPASDGSQTVTKCSRSQSLSHLTCSVGTTDLKDPENSPVLLIVSKLPGQTIPHIAFWKGSSITLGEYKILLKKEQGNSDSSLEQRFRYFFKCASNEFFPGLVYQEVQDDASPIPLWDGLVWGKIECG